MKEKDDEEEEEDQEEDQENLLEILKDKDSIGTTFLLPLRGMSRDLGEGVSRDARLSSDVEMNVGFFEGDYEPELHPSSLSCTLHPVWSCIHPDLLHSLISF